VILDYCNSLYSGVILHGRDSKSQKAGPFKCRVAVLVGVRKERGGESAMYYIIIVNERER